MKLKSKQKTLNITYPTRLFLEDIEQIYSIIKVVVDKVTIENDEFEFENIHELSEMKSPNLKNLSLIGYKNNWPIFFFFVYPKDIFIKIDQDEPSFLGTMEKLKEIISTRRLFSGISRTLQLILSSLLIFVASASAIVKIIWRTQIGINNALTYLTYALFLLVIFLVILPKNTIIVNYSKNTSSFWKRNRDKIIVSIITAVFTLILGYIFEKITGVIP